MSDIAFLGLDTETTGLDPETSHILEVGLVAFDDHLRPIAQTSRVFVVPEVVVHVRSAGRDLHPAVAKMHTETGLWDELHQRLMHNPPVNYSSVDALLVATLHGWYEQFGKPERALPMLGSSVHFDRRMMEGRFPKLLGEFSHRNIDASTLGEIVKAADPRLAKNLDSRFADSSEMDGVSGKAHRAVYDVHRSAALIRFLCREAGLRHLFPTTEKKD